MTESTDPGELLLLGASRLHRLQIEQLGLLDIPLTLRQYRILQRVGEGYTSVSEISRLAHRSLPTTSESVEGLIKRKLLNRAESQEDRRAVVLSLTPQGSKAVVAAKQCLDDLAAAIFETLPASKQKVLAQLAKTMYETSGSILWGDASD